MPPAARARLQALAAHRPELQLLSFSSEPLALIRAASAVVAMAGYNSTMEVLALEKNTLLVPRVVPREEQWLRARRLADLGLVHCLHPDELSPERVGAWLAGAASPSPRPRAREVLDFSGLQRVATLAAGLLQASPDQPAAAPSSAPVCPQAAQPPGIPNPLSPSDEPGIQDDPNAPGNPCGPGNPDIPDGAPPGP